MRPLVKYLSVLGVIVVLGGGLSSIMSYIILTKNLLMIMLLLRTHLKRTQMMYKVFLQANLKQSDRMKLG